MWPCALLRSFILKMVFVTCLKAQKGLLSLDGNIHPKRLVLKFVLFCRWFPIAVQHMHCFRYS